MQPLGQISVQFDSQWLEGLGLGEYAPKFEAERIELGDLSRLDASDLKELGLPLGPRKRLLDTIAMLTSRSETGAPLSTATRQKEGPLHRSVERRQLTVMFCDLVGSTQLSRRIDPEELRSLIRHYQDACVGAITRFEGHVAQYLGDGVLAYFGYPVALEGGAERAIRAGMAVIERIGELSMQLPTPLQVRVGIDTGLVVIGSEGNQQDGTAVGDAPNLAAKLQGLAQPGSVVVSERTRQLSPGSFDYRDLGDQSLKGIADAVRAWQVTRERTLETRFDAATGGTIAPMVGRDVELTIALHAWQRAKSGKVQVLLLCGEPGIGKSRVVRALREALAEEDVQPWQYQCTPYFSNTALYPIITHMERALRFERDESAEARLNKLDAMLRERFGRPELDAYLIARLFGLPAEQRYGVRAMSPQKQKDETLRALGDMAKAASEKGPIVLLYEDVHWADPTTLEAIDHVLKRAELHGMVVMTYRPEFKPPWIGEPNVTALTLARLDPEQTHAVANRVAGGNALPKEILAQIAAKTDGVPLFVEELTKAILESGLVKATGDRYELTGPLQTVAIPSSLRDSLMARLDRLAPVKEVAQIGACIGREFSDELLAAVSPLPRAQLHSALEQLVASELVFRRGTGKEARYFFKHALVQDAAYDSLLKSKRAELHGGIAKALERYSPETIATEPELLARHYTEAGNIDAAIPLWTNAGALALERFALQEALAHLDKGLDLTRALPVSVEREGREFELRRIRGLVCMALYGWAHTEVWTTYEPAIRLAKSLGKDDLLTPVFWGLSMNALVAGKANAARAWIPDALATAEKYSDIEGQVVAHMMGVVIESFRGDLLSASAHGDRLLELCQAHDISTIVRDYNHDPRTIWGIYASQWTWMLGFPDQAREICKRNVLHAQQLGHAFDLGFALGFGASVYHYRREPDRLLEHSAAATAIGEANNLPFIQYIQAQIPAVYARSLSPHENIEQFRRLIDLTSNAGVDCMTPYFKMLLAEQMDLAGESDEVDGLCLSALQEVDQPERKLGIFLSDMLRIRAEIFHRRGEVKEAEDCYLAAQDCAAKQGARSWELRAATSLARLCNSQGRQRQAHDLLAPIYNWFTEGFDTKDLKEAKALLDELSR